MIEVTDLTRVTPMLECRAATAENRTGARSVGAQSGGRTDTPVLELTAGERVLLADLHGPGTVRRIWLALPLAPPPVMRSTYLEVFYDDLDEPSISVPCLDFFGAPHGRPAAYASALTSTHEGGSFVTYLPLPFGERMRMELVNGGDRRTRVRYQVDYTIDAVFDTGRLHATFRRQNPTSLGADFVVATGLRGPGRFVGCVLGIRPVDPGFWYGEGEVKIYRDGDTVFPTVRGTTLGGYVRAGWRIAPAVTAYAGVSLEVRPPYADLAAMPDYVGCYRWHVPDPVMFASWLTVTVQQIGADFLPPGEGTDAGGVGRFERVDDYCATAFTLCERAQPVPRVDIHAAVSDIDRRSYERPNPIEAQLRGIVLL